jgi:hypothetical protein
MGSSLLIIHSSNEQMASSNRCYCKRARLPMAQSSNGRRDIGSMLLLGVQIIAPKSRRPLLLDRARLSVTHCSNGYESSARCYCEFEASCPIIKASLQICHRWQLELPERCLLSPVQPITFSLSKLSILKRMASHDSSGKRKLEEEAESSMARKRLRLSDDDAGDDDSSDSPEEETEEEVS